MRLHRVCACSLLLATVVTSTGCGTDHEDLERYVARIKARSAAPIEPIPEIMPYTPFTYRADGQRSPFTPTTPEPEQSNNDLAPDLKRPLEPLEAYPLDALRMRGTISRSGVTYALLLAPDDVIHRVRRGNHIGQNYGEITAISEHGVTLTELVPDGRGGYTRRPAAIAPTR